MTYGRGTSQQISLVNPFGIDIDGVGETIDPGVILRATAVTSDRADRMLHIESASA